jgi:hypothetical protein
VDTLIGALNTRGFRESQLREALERDKGSLQEWVAKCPNHKLNGKFADPEEGVRKSKRITVNLMHKKGGSQTSGHPSSSSVRTTRSSAAVFFGACLVLVVVYIENWSLNWINFKLGLKTYP